MILSENISSESFYEKFWEKAIAELDIKYIQDGAEFNKTKLDVVLKELGLLKEWSISNLHGEDKEYMRSRIENLEKVIPTAFTSEQDILHIF
ncbi:hypothetical protein [uncultured Enterococcus sp.]|uniref:hypothetical protein n=1 Tax=uncultured Enterococcus sp. TaxID=167972 RepID=UPI002AA79BB4|nr:hypothetical protein [uncultured Enterococcus sp.]